jgi:hypothetical protein
VQSKFVNLTSQFEEGLERRGRKGRRGRRGRRRRRRRRKRRRGGGGEEEGEEEEVDCSIFLLDGGEWQVSCSGHFTPEE